MRKQLITAALILSLHAPATYAGSDTIKILQADHDQDGNVSYIVEIADDFEATDYGLRRITGDLNNLPAHQMKSVWIVNPGYLPQTITSWPFGAAPGDEADPEE
jgi:hypothetical protein